MTPFRSRHACARESERKPHGNAEESRMRVHVVVSGLLVAAVIAFSGSVDAQPKGKRGAQPGVCNVKEQLAALESDRSNVFGPAFYITRAKTQLKEFKKSILEIMDKDGIIPGGTSPDAAPLRKQFVEYADVDKDLADFDELLKSSVIANNPDCKKCVLKTILGYVNVLGYKIVSEEALAEIKTSKVVDFKKQVELYSQLKANPISGDSTTADDYRLSIERVFLDTLPGSVSVKGGWNK